MTSNQGYIQEKGKSSNLEKFLQSLPCTGICKLILTGISIILTVMISTANEKEKQEESLQCILHITIYISFSISGLLDIGIFYMPKNFFPRHTDSFSIVIAFLVECLAFSENKEITKPGSSCLVMAINCCLISSVLRMISSSSIATLSLIMFTQIQGTWLLHSAFINYSLTMSYLYFPGMFCLCLFFKLQS